jgi:hypothetical protein
MTNTMVDIATRAAWTAAQAFLAVFVVADVTTVRTAAVAAIAAAVSVLKTAVASKVAA